MNSKWRVPVVVASLLLAVGMACGFSVNPGEQTSPEEGSFDAEGKPISPTPTVTPTETPTLTVTPVPLTNTPRPTATPSPSVTPTITNTPGSGGFPPILLTVGPIVVPINPTLDYTADPNYGEGNLSAGYVPDPYSVGLTSGGDVDVSYLGGGCSGYATSNPDFRLNYAAGGSSLLRFYFIGSNGDTTMVVNDPYGNYYCVDDSFGTLNPTIDFSNPTGGTYDVWIGSYASGTFVSGTLYITELSGNHP